MELPYPIFNEGGKVICQLCGKPFLVISPSHLKKYHGVTFEQYKLRFGNNFSSKEFVTKMKYGKYKDKMKDPENDIIIGDDIQIIDEPVIEDDFDVAKVLEKTLKDKDPITKIRRQFLDRLRFHFANMRENYVVNDHTIGGVLKYEYITDFCDPILRIIVDFPQTFWHNVDSYYDLMKNRKLEEDGWMIITVLGRSPSFEDVDRAVREAMIVKSK
jgi:very-short-patch-repair endonuclease